jgi:serine/threonine-protein kinase RsbW
MKLPCLLEYRDLAMRMVTSACKLVEARHLDRTNGKTPVHDEWSDRVISAFGEAFNNVVLHAYGSEGGDLEIEIEPADDRLTIRLIDYGKAFDFDSVQDPDLDNLPESGLGIYIIRACMDSVSYHSGTPNILSMTKYLVRLNV